MTPLRILTGQTASGKSSVAVCLAKNMDAELISVDSMKVYRGLDIGTAKPSRAVRNTVPFHMVDVVEPREVYSLARYLEDARATAEAIARRGRKPVFVGGTSLYLRGLLYGIFDGPPADRTLREELKRRAEEEGPQKLHEELQRVDPVTARRLHPNDLVRIVRALEVAATTGKPISACQKQYPAPKPAVDYRMVALRRSDEDLRERIARRAERMFERGVVDEVRAVLQRGGISPSASRAIGYREVLAYLRGGLSCDAMVESVKRSTWRLARKQRTWLKSFPDVHWLDVPPDESPETTVGRVRELLFGSGMTN